MGRGEEDQDGGVWGAHYIQHHLPLQCLTTRHVDTKRPHLTAYQWRVGDLPSMA